MKKTYTIQCPAKINIHLSVGAKRADGFHPIASIFQAVSLYDTLTIEHTGFGGRIDIEAPCSCPPEHNTVYKAASLFTDAAAARLGAKPSLRLCLVKKIPEAAGLGGGSSDAAGALKVLSALFPDAVPTDVLLGIAEALGSDVPFFLDSPCAFVTGRGETLLPMRPRADYSVVLLQPRCAVSTQKAYRALDDFRTGKKLPPLSEIELERSGSALREAYEKLSPALWPFTNDFYDCIADLYPEIRQHVAMLRSCGALFAAMSGSGSAVFGIFPAQTAAVALPVQYEPIVSFPLASMPIPT